MGSWLLLGKFRTRVAEADGVDHDHLILLSSFRLRPYFQVTIVGFRAFCLSNLDLEFGNLVVGSWNLRGGSWVGAVGVSRQVNNFLLFSRCVNAKKRE